MFELFVNYYLHNLSSYKRVSTKVRIQPKKFPLDFQDTFNKVPVNFYVDQSFMISITIVCTLIWQLHNIKCIAA